MKTAWLFPDWLLTLGRMHSAAIHRAHPSLVAMRIVTYRYVPANAIVAGVTTWPVMSVIMPVGWPWPLYLVAATACLRLFIMAKWPRRT